jgi:hypothetical protein
VEDHNREQMKVAYREVEGEEYVILWPHDLKEFHIL